VLLGFYLSPDNKLNLKKMNKIFTIKSLLTSLVLLSQLIVDAQNRRNVDPQLFKISIDEDYLNYRGNGTDRYYTAGIEFDYFFKKSKSNIRPFSVRAKDLSTLYFISLKQIINTPNIIARPGFQKGDYPYAGVLYGTFGSIHSSEISRNRFTKTFSVGMLGPKAFAGETQIFAHRLIHYTRPLGWNTQIKSELIFNYMTRLDKGVFSFGNKMDVITTTELNAGTVYDNVSTGFTLRLGKLNSYFSNYNIINLAEGNKHKKSIYFFVNPSLTIVGYNGTLQGGLSDGKLKYSKNDYFVSSGDINRLLSKLTFGINYESKKFSASFSQVIQSAEFTTVDHHEYGNISIAFLL
jgi:hypothetical protein